MGNVTSFHVTGDWRHVVDDGMVDVDALPDEALPTGHVVFTPIAPKVAVAGAPAVAHTLGEIKALISAGELTDLQGRAGVWMAGDIGGQTVRWRATTHLFYQGQKIAYPVLEFDLTGDAVLTGIIQNSEPGQPPIVIDPRIEALIADAQAVLSQAQDAIEGLEDSAAGASAARDEAVSSAAAALVSEGNAATSETNSKASEVAADEDRVAAEQARDQAQGHATEAQEHSNDSSSAATAARGYRDEAQTAADATGEDRVHVDQVRTILEALLADTEAWAEVQGALENARSQWLGDVQAALDELKAGVDPALDTLQELAAALGNDPNFSATVVNALGEKATKDELESVRSGLQSAIDAISWSTLPGKPSTFPAAPHEHEWSEIQNKPGTYPPGTHEHTIGQINGLDTELQNKANASQLGGKTIVVVSELPASPDEGTIYLIEEA